MSTLAHLAALAVAGIQAQMEGREIGLRPAFSAPYGRRRVVFIGGYRKRHPITAAQVQRASIKAKNRAKHRRACRG